MRAWLILYLLCLSPLTYADKLRFSLHKLTSDKPGPTMLVIGGIQGDEPGGFTAASMLVTNYKIKSGNVWVVPNLNFASIIRRSRGIYGDMNRKFRRLAENDPEYAEVQKIKKIILDQDVDIILNLHDGSGFYRKKYINKLYNPRRWGQSIIIDQEKIQHKQFGHLNAIASFVQESINKQLKNSDKFFYVKNTRTNKGNPEMEKSLTYFAIRHHKPAFAVEASKNFLTHERTYYHLLAVEGFMHKLGIGFERDFKMTRRSVAHQIGSNLQISLYDNRINLDVANSRRVLNYIPLKKHADIEYKKSNPLLAIIDHPHGLKVRYGNRFVTSLRPQYFEYDDSLQSLQLEIDGRKKTVNIGDRIHVDKSFRVLADRDYRVNVIGFSRPGLKNENQLLVRRKHIQSRFSVDRGRKVFRVELYRGERFSGMILVDFSKQQKTGAARKMFSNEITSSRL